MIKGFFWCCRRYSIERRVPFVFVHTVGCLSCCLSFSRCVRRHLFRFYGGGLYRFVLTPLCCLGFVPFWLEMLRPILSTEHNVANQPFLLIFHRLPLQLQLFLLLSKLNRYHFFVGLKSIGIEEWPSDEVTDPTSWNRIEPLSVGASSKIDPTVAPHKGRYKRTLVCVCVVIVYRVPSRLGWSRKTCRRQSHRARWGWRSRTFVLSHLSSVPSLTCWSAPPSSTPLNPITKQKTHKFYEVISFLVFK